MNFASSDRTPWENVRNVIVQRPAALSVRVAPRKVMKSNIDKERAKAPAVFWVRAHRRGAAKKEARRRKSIGKRWQKERSITQETGLSRGLVYFLNQLVALREQDVTEFSPPQWRGTSPLAIERQGGGGLTERFGRWRPLPEGSHHEEVGSSQHLPPFRDLWAGDRDGLCWAMKGQNLKNKNGVPCQNVGFSVWPAVFFGSKPTTVFVDEGMTCQIIMRFYAQLTSAVLLDP